MRSRVNLTNIVGMPRLTAAEVNRLHGHAETMQDSEGRYIRIRLGQSGLEKEVNGQWVPIGDIRSVVNQNGVRCVEANNYIVPSTHTKITYDAKGLVTGGTSADVSDIDGLPGALAAKADASHSHAQSDVTGLSASLSLKADLSSDGQRVRIYDTGTATYRYIKCTNGVLTVEDS